MNYLERFPLIVAFCFHRDRTVIEAETEHFPGSAVMWLQQRAKKLLLAFSNVEHLRKDHHDVILTLPLASIQKSVTERDVWN